MSTVNQTGERGTCFVVMGFGKKTDFETGRTLDLDKTYRNIIKPAARDAGLKCVRADEIVHSGLIDVPMYEQLLTADVVIADLSTSNKNAFYELGIRHALRPHTTIVISENGMKIPFDVNHVVVRQYVHRGDSLDYDEVEQFRSELVKAIDEILKTEPHRPDSPIYVFLNKLKPPTLEEVMEATEAVDSNAAPDDDGGAAEADEQTHSLLMQRVAEAQNKGNIAQAKALLETVYTLLKEAETAAKERGVPPRPVDADIVQRLALLTYKEAEAKNRDEAKKADAKGRQLTATEDERASDRLKLACEEARDLLATLNPETTNDPETLGLWGAVHKRLWEVTGEREYLNESVRGYERGFYLRNDYYNGINFAYLLNVRAADAMRRAGKPDGADKAVALHAEAIADFVQAGRVRREVLTICEQWLESNPPPDEEKASKQSKAAYASGKYWVMATAAEARLGLGEAGPADKLYDDAYALAPNEMMADSTREQRLKLEALLADSPLKYVKAKDE